MTKIFWIYTVSILSLAIWVTAQQSKPVPPAVKFTPCVPADNEICAPQAFLEEWADLKALDAAIIADPAYKKLRAKMDQESGMQARMAKEVPTGYQFFPATGKFVRTPPPTAAPTPPAATDKK